MWRWFELITLPAVLYGLVKLVAIGWPIFRAEGYATLAFFVLALTLVALHVVRDCAEAWADHFRQRAQSGE